MSRIRTVKPEFFRHEQLQDLERENPGAYPMLVFSGLWTLCDKAGRFEWRPRQIKLDLLPFLPFDMEATLALLAHSGLVVPYSVDGREYGLIPTFPSHQRITGKEAQAPHRYPAPPQEVPGKHLGSTQGDTGETPDAQERKGKGKGKGKESTTPLPPKGEKEEGDPVVLHWFGLLWEKWPHEQPDGTAAPRASKAETMKRFCRIITAAKVSPRELATCGGLYIQEQAKAKRYVCSAETFLGTKRIWEEYLERSRAVIAKAGQQAEAAHG